MASTNPGDQGEVGVQTVEAGMWRDVAPRGTWSRRDDRTIKEDAVPGTTVPVASL